MRRFLAPAAFCLLVLHSSPAFAQAGGDLDWLFGLWTGGGTSMGQPSESTFEAQPALGGAFAEFRYALTKPFSFEGRAFYQEGEDGAWSADWFDSRGVTFKIDAHAGEKRLTSRWKGAAEQGETLYRLLEDGRLEIVDSVIGKDGKMGVFARQTFSKAD